MTSTLGGRAVPFRKPNVLRRPEPPSRATTGTTGQDHHRVVWGSVSGQRSSTTLWVARLYCERQASSPCGDSSEDYGPGMDFYSKRPSLVADERTQLTGWLDLQRALVRRKLEGLAEADEHRVALPESPMMTPAGLVSHMRWTEHCWFNVIFLGESSADNPQLQKEPKDADMRVDAYRWRSYWASSRRSSRSRTRSSRATRSTRSGRTRSSRRRCGGSCSTWSRRLRGTSGTSTSCASCSTARKGITVRCDRPLRAVPQVRTRPRPELPRPDKHPVAAHRPHL